MKLLIVIPLIILSVYCSKSAEFTDFQKQYDKIFHQEIYIDKDQKSLLVYVEEIPEIEKFSGIINPNIQNIDYLYTHFMNKDVSHIVNEPDSLNRHKKLIYLLKNDSLFNSLMYEYFSVMLNSNNYKKDTFSISFTMNIASKFFYLHGLDKNKNYMAHICIGVNAIKITEPQRYPLLEAFVYSYIMNNIYNEDLPLMQMMTDNIKKIYAFNLGENDNENILRAQGILFYMMYSNENLRKAIIDEYSKQKDLLPFVIKL